jgi:hypothetical protein
MNRIFLSFFWLAFPILLGLYSFGCSPSIHSFTVYPIYLAHNENPRFIIDVSGTAQIDTIPLGHGIKDTTKYKLSVTKCDSTTTSYNYVVRYPLSCIDTLRFDPLQRLGTDSLIATVSLNDTTWSSHLLLGSISSASGCFIRIIHNGIDAQLNSDGSPTFAFQNVPIIGNWELHAPIVNNQNIKRLKISAIIMSK